MNQMELFIALKVVNRFANMCDLLVLTGSLAIAILNPSCRIAPNDLDCLVFGSESARFAQFAPPILQSIDPNLQYKEGSVYLAARKLIDITFESSRKNRVKRELTNVIEKTIEGIKVFVYKPESLLKTYESNQRDADSGKIALLRTMVGTIAKEDDFLMQKEECLARRNLFE